MQDPKTNRTLPVSIITGVSLLILAVGGGTLWWRSTSQTQTPPQPTPSVVTSTPVPTQPVTQSVVQVYWLRDTGNAIDLVPGTVNLKTEPQSDRDRLAAAFENLFQGSSDQTLSSAIPAGTQLRSLTLKPDGIHLDLSPEFGQGGGTASMMGRLGQVVYTATSLQPDAKVWLSVNGKPLELLGGEGLEIPQPITRKQFDQDFAL